MEENPSAGNKLKGLSVLRSTIRSLKVMCNMVFGFTSTGLSFEDAEIIISNKKKNITKVSKIPTMVASINFKKSFIFLRIKVFNQDINCNFKDK
jgi:hypothetical protein